MRPAFRYSLCDSPLWSMNAALWSAVLTKICLVTRLESWLILNIMNTKLIGYQTNRIWNLSNMELMGYRTYGIQNLWDTELMGYRTYWIQNLWDTELIGYRFLNTEVIFILNYVRHRTLSDTYLFIFMSWTMVYHRQNHQSVGLLWLLDIWRREEEEKSG